MSIKFAIVSENILAFGPSHFYREVAIPGPTITCLSPHDAHSEVRIRPCEPEPRMSKPSRQFGRSTRLMTETASASAAVIAARVSKLGDPREFMSARQQREIGGMVSEKMIAGMQGWTSAVAEAWLLPSRAMATLARPSLLTPAGAARAACEIGALWMGVGDAALRPAKRKATSNRARLRKTGK